MAHLPASKAREGFADTINRVAFGKERVVLRRHGKEVAAVVPIADLRLLEELEDHIDLADARAALAEAKKKGAKPLDAILKNSISSLPRWPTRSFSPFLPSDDSRHSRAASKADRETPSHAEREPAT